MVLSHISKSSDSNQKPRKHCNGVGNQFMIYIVYLNTHQILFSNSATNRPHNLIVSIHYQILSPKEKNILLPNDYHFTQ